VVTSFLDKAHPPIISLAVFTALLVGMSVWMLFALRPVDEGGDTALPTRKRRYSRTWDAMPARPRQERG
jgi:hypothetical protein